MIEPNEERPAINAGDHLANERTFLAWVRTSISFMALGFVVVKFTLFIKQLSFVLSTKVALPGKGYSSIIGILLVGLGAVIGLLAYVRFKQTEQRLLFKTYKPSSQLSLLVTVSILVISCLLIYYLLPSL